jgi:transcriptional regulator of arginine metabolism
VSAAFAGKARRQQAILDLVRSRPIASQDELVQALARRGHQVTQATLSRDLREMRVLRVPVAGGARYLPAGEQAAATMAPAGTGMGRLAAAEVLGVDANESAVVIRTLTGRAQGVAVLLDGLGLPAVLATVAGDDTILVLPRSTRKTSVLRRRLAEIFQLGERKKGKAAS